MPEAWDRSKKRMWAKRILGDPDLYPAEMLGWIPRFLNVNPELSLQQDQLPDVDTVHVIGDTAAGEPAYQNSFEAYDTTYGGARFYIDPWGRVFLTGMVKRTSSVSGSIVMFSLPAGYRPEFIELHDTLQTVASTLMVARIDIAPNGDVIWVQTSGTGTLNWCTLAGISFRAFT